jgi:nitrate reductase alpha subunit
MTDIEPIKGEIVKAEEETLSLQVINPETYGKAGELLKLNKGLEKKIKEYFKPLKQAQDQAKKLLLDAEKEELNKLQPAINHLNKQMTAWNIEQEKIRKAEEDRLRREAEKKAEEEQLQAAIEAEKSGNNEEADAILEEPVFVPPPIVEKTVPKQAGLTMTTTWKWRVTNYDKIPRQFLQVNEVAINQTVRGLKENTKIPGIEVYPEQSMRGVRS